MSTEAIAEKVKIVPLYVHDGAWKKEDGSYCGTLTIITKPTYEIGARTIGDVNPYGGNFPDYEEAKVYAKLFVDAPDMAESIREYISTTENPYSSESDKAQAYENLKESLNKATL